MHRVNAISHFFIFAEHTLWLQFVVHRIKSEQVMPEGCVICCRCFCFMWSRRAVYGISSISDQNHSANSVNMTANIKSLHRHTSWTRPDLYTVTNAKAEAVKQI